MTPEKFKDFVDNRPFVEPTDPPLLYAAAAMAFEAGEAGDIIKKIVRGDDVDSREFIIECGDVLYYMTKTLSMMGYTLEQALAVCVKKLNLREELGKGPDEEVLWHWLDNNIEMVY